MEKIVIGYCDRYETVILMFFIGGFKEGTIRLWKEECLQ